MIACLFSGGKDSTMALHKVIEGGKKVDLLLTMIPENEYSYMFHKPNISFTYMQSNALGIEQVQYRTKGVKEKELADLEDALKENEVTELITGAVASTYQRDRINALCERLSIKHVAPLWQVDPMAELRELAEKYRVIVTQVAAEGFDQSILGKILDAKMIEKLKKLNETYRTNMLFEGGEAESFVLDAPLFQQKIEIRESHVVWEGQVGRYIIDEAVLRDK